MINELLIKCLIAFIAAFIFIKLLIQFASKLGLVDVPNHRSVHQKITPRGAGIGIVFGVIASDLLLLNDMVYSHLATFIAIFLVFVVGILDDHRDTKPRTKFIVIILATLLIYSDNIVIDSLGHLFGYEISLGWFALPFTIFAVAGFTNALNLSDGLDGLAASISIIILGTLALIGYHYEDQFILSISLSFIAALCAFLWFNWNPAKIFMGDSGSLTLGFVIAVLAIKSLSYIQPATILFIAAIPIMDTIIVMIRRKRNKKSIFAPDKTHIHHILLKFFDGHVKKSVGVIIMMQLLFSLMGFDFTDYPKQRFILLLFILNTAIFYIFLTGMLARQNKFSFYRKIKRKQSLKK